MDMDGKSSMAQRISDEGRGYQTEIHGDRQNIHTGEGHQYNADRDQYNDCTMYFGQHVRPKVEILRELNYFPYRERKNKNRARVLGTCEWFTSHQRFIDWRDGDRSNLLLVSANPGCGKSILAKYLIDSVLPTTSSRTTCYFFFKDIGDQKSVKAALSSILHQLFARRANLLTDRLAHRLGSYNIQHGASFEDLWDVLIAAAQHHDTGQLLCVLDALDECEEEDAKKLTQALRNLYGQQGRTRDVIKLKFLVTSRPLERIKRGILPLNAPELPVIHLQGESNAEVSKIEREVDACIAYRIPEIRRKLGLSFEMEQMLLRELRSVPNRTYLWGSLTLDLVEDAVDISDSAISSMIKSLPKTLDAAYDETLQRSPDPGEAKKVLHIVVAAVRLLTLLEMEIALGRGQSHELRDGQLDESAKGFKQYIEELCSFFITIVDGKIYLTHQTAKEFLVGEEESNPPRKESSQLKWKSSLRPSESHQILCRICMVYLNLPEFNGQVPRRDCYQVPDSYLARYPLLEYSASHWVTHFRASNLRNKAVAKLLRQLCDAGSARWWTWFRVYWVRKYPGIIYPMGVTTLIVASYFGIEHVVQCQLEEDRVNIDAIDGIYGRSALSWASENGFDRVVELILKRLKRGPIKAISKPWFVIRPMIDREDIDGRTPLSYAAWNGHTTVVELLVKHGARVDSTDALGLTPISYALVSGQEAVLDQMGQRATNVVVDLIPQELIHRVAISGDITMMERLLERGGDIDAHNEHGESPLYFAARGRAEAIARLLIERGATIDTEDMHGQTPLNYAIRGREDAVARLLIERGAAIDAQNKFGQTPLDVAEEVRRGPVSHTSSQERIAEELRKLL